MELVVNEQRLRVNNITSLKTGNVETYTLSLKFGQEYNDLAKVIVYITDKDTINQDVVNEATINIPAEALEFPTKNFSIGVFGYKTNEAGEIIEKRYSTNLVALPVVEGSYNGKNPTPPSASVWERYIAEMNRIYNETKGVKTATEVVKSETETIKDETETIKQQTELIKEETEGIKNVARDFVGAVTFTEFEVTDNMELVICTAEKLGNIGFDLDDDGVLEVEIL